MTLSDSSGYLHRKDKNPRLWGAFSLLSFCPSAPCQLTRPTNADVSTRKMMANEFLISSLVLFVSFLHILLQYSDMDFQYAH